MTTYKNYDELCRKTKQMPPDTDLLAFTNLYKRFGIECKIDCIFEEGKTIGFAIFLSTEPEYPSLAGVTTDDKITGCAGFSTIIIFDKNGKFKKQRIIE